ncbi:MAG: murein hydrolase activator EnvC family protein [Anaerorhabdus sp.]
MKKVVSITLSLLMVTGFITPVLADDEDFEENKTEYTLLCSKPTSELTEDEQDLCTAFLQYVSNQSADLKEQLDDLEAQREVIAANIQEYTQKIRSYDATIAGIGEEIAEINENISVMESTIAAKELEITEKEAAISALRETIKNRMVESQSSMRLNNYLDIIMGSKDLNDLVRRSNGLNDIANYDERTRVELQTLVAELSVEKEELEASKVELEVHKAEIKSKQDQIILLRAEANIAKEEALKQEADLEALGNTIAADYESLKQLAQSISENLNEIPNSSGFTRPIIGGRITAGTWNYPASFGGGVHLGVDYAASSGTNIRAAGNGYILKSVDGCPYGYIGSSCGSAQGGSTGGGNQVYLLTNISGTLYAVKYIHLLQGTPISQGTIVDAGDTIGQMGSSGNSTGVHTHVEVIKLGTMSINSYVQSWNGDLSFGAGWGSAALAKTCDKVSAPCRVRPESVFE